MRRNRQHIDACAGFSLIEIIAVLVLISVAGGALYSYFASAFVESHKPLEKSKQSYDLHKVMENITADYALNYHHCQKRYPVWQKMTYYVKDTVIRASDKGYVYQCTADGKSGSKEPLDGGSPVSEGSLKWKRLSDLNDLKKNITPVGYVYPTLLSNNYGSYMVSYMVTENKFIEFMSDGSSQDSVRETILKVTITNESGATLTSLFTNVN